MARLALRYPAYTWERNVGYTTRAHIRGLDSNGITPHHRRSFFRVSQLMLALDEPQSLLEIPSDARELVDDLAMLDALDGAVVQDIAQA